MGEVVRLVAPISAPTQRGCNVMDNRRSGFRLMYCSMKEALWYRDVAKKAVMFHLILEVAHEHRTVVFGGKRVHLSRGQLVCSAKSLGLECGISEDQPAGHWNSSRWMGQSAVLALAGRGGTPW